MATRPTSCKSSWPDYRLLVAVSAIIGTNSTVHPPEQGMTLGGLSGLTARHAGDHKPAPETFG